MMLQFQIIIHIMQLISECCLIFFLMFIYIRTIYIVKSKLHCQLRGKTDSLLSQNSAQWKECVQAKL